LAWALDKKKKEKKENMEGGLVAAFFHKVSHEWFIKKSINRTTIFPASRPVLVAERVGFMVY